MTLDRPPPADLVVDTSALAAILLDEPAAARCGQVLDRALGPLVSSANVMELLMVMDGRRGPVGVSETKAFLHDARLITMPVDDVTVQEATRRGRGSAGAATEPG